MASQQPDGLALHLYAESDLRGTVAGGEVKLAVRTDYPWTEEVAIEIRPAAPLEFTLRLRIPGWCRGATLAVNGRPQPVAPVNGYAVLRRVWQVGDQVVLTLPMPIERVRADPRVATAAGKVALQRGPVVYCVEEPDNGTNLAALALPRTAALTARHDAALLGGCTVIEGQGVRFQPGPSLYTTTPPATASVPLRAIPYGLWANRGEGEMRVWIQES